MNTRDITYSKLEQILNKTGFEVTAKKGSHNIYKHKQLDSIIVLPDVGKRKTVRPVHALAVKRTLVANGLISNEDFDKAITNKLSRNQVETKKILKSIAKQIKKIKR